VKLFNSLKENKVDETNLINTHFKFGLGLLGLGIFLLISLNYNNNMPREILFPIIVMQIIIACIFIFGKLLFNIKNDLIKQILAIQGVIIFLAVLFYTGFMWNVITKILNADIQEIKKIAHAPGILTFLSLYAATLFGTFLEAKEFPRKFITTTKGFTFGIGIMCDAFITIAMIHLFVKFF